MTNGNYVRVEAADMDEGAAAMYRYDPATGNLRIAFDANRPAAAAADLTRLFADLQHRGILTTRAPRGVSAGH